MLPIVTACKKKEKYLIFLYVPSFVWSHCPTMATKIPQKQPRLAVRFPKGSDLPERLAAVLEAADGVDEPKLILACVKAVIEYMERNGEITFPLVVLPRSALKKKLPLLEVGRRSPTGLHGLNEPEAEYRAAPKSKTK